MCHISVPFSGPPRKKQHPESCVVIPLIEDSFICVCVYIYVYVFVCVYVYTCIPKKVPFHFEPYKILLYYNILGFTLLITVMFLRSTNVVAYGSSVLFARCYVMLIL